jgi:hypothetical protein
MAKFDPSNPEYRSAPMLPPGKHIVIVASVEATVAKTGTPMLKHKLRCIDPASPSNGHEIFTNTMLSGGGAFRTAELANVIAQTKANKAVTAQAFDPAVLEDLQRVFWAAPFVVVCGEREYDGKKQSDVQSFEVLQPTDRKRMMAAHGPSMMPTGPAVPAQGGEDDTFVPANYEGGDPDDII